MHTNAEDAPREPRTDEPDIRSVPAGLFAAWRRMISGLASIGTRTGAGVRRLAARWARQWPLVRAYHAGAALPWEPAGDRERRAAAALGLRAFVFGLVLCGIGTSASTSRWLPIAVAVGSQVLWAGVRFIIVALLMPRGAIDRARLSTAYLAGLTPYVFAATWALQLAALAASALLTARGLLGAGVPRRDVRIAIAWAFGGQVAVAAGLWVMRALVVLAVR